MHKMDFTKIIAQIISHFIYNSTKDSTENLSPFSESFFSYHRAKYFQYLALFNSDAKFTLETTTPYSNQRNAIWYFLHSALKGYSVSQYELGICYLKGQLGLQPNLQQAEKWLALAAKQGHLEAIDELKNIDSSQSSNMMQ
ncbi:sel1 repeat family protein [Acinetobacter gerneri]|nr:sel1 repeat family protein [Acinetobacter gerneri]